MAHEKQERVVIWLDQIAFAALLLAIALSPILAGSILQANSAVIRMLILASSILLGLAYLWPKTPFHRSPLYAPTAIYLFLAVISILWTISRYASLLAILDLSSEVLLIFLILNLITSRERTNYLLGAFAIAIAIVCIWGMREYFAYGVGEWKQAVASGLAAKGISGLFKFLLTSPPEWRIYGPFLNPNVFGNFLIMAIPVSFSRYLLSEDRAETMGVGFLLVMEVTALLLTASKGAWIALVIAMAIYGVLAWYAGVQMGPKPANRMSIMGLILLAIGVLFAKPMLTRLQASTTTEAHSGTFRTYLWKSTLHIIKDHPFGTGIGTFDRAYPHYAIAGPSQNAHNGYLQIASEIGIPGLIAFLVIFIVLARSVVISLIEHRRKSPARQFAVPLLIIGFTCAVIASAIHNLVDYGWYIQATGITLWVAIAMTQVASGIDEPIRAVPKPWTKIAILAGVIILAILAFFNMRISTGRTYADSATEFERQGNLNETLSSWEAAEATDPWNPSYADQVSRLLIMGGQADRALIEIKKAISAEPDNPMFWRTLAVAKEISQDMPGARKAYIRTAQLYPNTTEVWRRLAEFETKSNRPQAALKAWRQLAKLETSPVGRCPAVPELVDTNYAVAHTALAQQAAKQKQWSQAIEQYRQAEDIFKKYEASKTTVQYQSMEYMGGVNKREERQLAQLRIDLLHQQSKAYQAMGEPINSERVEKLANELSQKENSQ